MGRVVLGVTGIPGAWANVVAKRLEHEQGWSVLWPGQDLGCIADKTYYGNGENPAAVAMHDGILDALGEGWFTTRWPRFYDPPYPGPREYLAKFPVDARLVISDPRLCLFLPLWIPFLDGLAICQLSAHESSKKIQEWHGGGVSLDACRLVAHHYESSLRRSSAGFLRKVELTHEQLATGDPLRIMADQNWF